MISYAEQIHAAVDAVRIVSPTSFTWFGVRSPAVARRVRPMLTEDLARSHLIAALGERLYRDFYCSGAARTGAEQPQAVTSGGRRLALALSLANAGTGSWEPGWTVSAVDDDVLAVRRGGLALWVRPSDCQPASTHHGGVMTRGHEVAVRIPAESFELSPGYYCALSDEPFRIDSSSVLVRIYLNLRPEHAARGVAVLTASLNAARVPFRLKVLADEHNYQRCDTGVLYLRRDTVEEAAHPLRDSFPQLASALRPMIPSLTKSLAPGVGLAEDPGSPGESYGQHRCGVLALGLVRAHESGMSRHASRFQCVMEEFEAHGIDLSLPYLRCGSTDTYDLLAPRQPLRLGSSDESRPTLREAAVHSAPSDGSSADIDRAQWQEVAASIAHRLVSDAMWHGDFCSWLGPVITFDNRGNMDPSYGNVGVSLYDGDSGIALFLALFAAVTGDPAAARTARAGANRALAVAQGHKLTRSLYSGTLGTVLAAVTVGCITHDDALVGTARSLLDKLLKQECGDQCFDLLAGDAGAAVGLLTLSQLIPDDEFIQAATRFGDRLIRAAQRAEDGSFSWPDGSRARHPNLTGLSHGAAGAACAFLELHRVTEEQRWVEAAERAFRYEQNWYSPVAGNWPDLRNHDLRSRRSTTFLTQWCHGAPGIALTRLRAAELTGSDSRREEAVRALSTTALDTDRALRDRSLSFSLCHGLAGNADVLLEGAAVAHDAGLSTSALLGEIATAGRIRHQLQREPWPCGIPLAGRETPSLMLGLAGIGYFYLRMSTALVPSLLLLQPERFAASVSTLSALRRLPRTNGVSLSATPHLPGPVRSEHDG
jgi:hypothetical protein